MNCLSSIRHEVNRLWPYTAILSKSFCNYRLVGSSNEQKVTDEVLAQLISEVENDPVSKKASCAAYIQKLCGSGNISDAARLVRSLHARQIFLNPKTYNVLVTSVGEEKDFKLLFQIFKGALPSCDLGPVFYSNLAKAFSNLTDFDGLLKFIDEVSEMVFPNGAIIMNKIIVGFAESKQIDKALVIFDLMKNLKCKPDLVTYNIVLDMLGQAGLIDEMLNTFSSMKETGISPDIISYNPLINNLRRFGRLDLCLVFLREMFEKEVDPDLRTYTALIDCLGRSGRTEEALGLFGQMKRRGIHPSVYTYRSLISNLNKVGKLKLAKSLSEEMNSSVSDSQLANHV